MLIDRVLLDISHLSTKLLMFLKVFLGGLTLIIFLFFKPNWGVLFAIQFKVIPSLLKYLRIWIVVHFFHLGRKTVRQIPIRLTVSHMLHGAKFSLWISLPLWLNSHFLIALYHYLQVLALWLYCSLALQNLLIVQILIVWIQLLHLESIYDIWRAFLGSKLLYGVICVQLMLIWIHNLSIELIGLRVENFDVFSSIFRSLGYFATWLSWFKL